MTRQRLAAVDAQTFWMSTKIPNDQLLLYRFDGAPTDFDAALAQVRARAAGVAPLCLRLDDHRRRDYPAWVPRPVGDDQFVVHDAVPTWTACLDAVAALTLDPLDVRTAAWRLHLFPRVDTGVVAVLQISHALGDGIRASALAARLFGRDAAVPGVAAVPWYRPATLPWRAVRAARAHRALIRDTAAGAVPPPAPSRPVLRTNTRPAGRRAVRVLTRRRAELDGPTVTVAVLAAIAEALAGHLAAAGDDPSELGAEVPMARPGARRAANHFGNVGIGLHPGLPRAARMGAIAAELAARRRRAAHPAVRAEADALAAVPAPLLRWGVHRFDADARAVTVTGNTVVSSVNRGAADLRLGDAPVAVTAGFPALSPMMGLTHGVHGIGDTVAISVHAAESAIGDLDAYLSRVDRALG